MLKSINTTLQRKQEDMSSRSSVSVLVKQAVQDYIQRTYPEAVMTVSVQYDVQERLVVISTPSKALAGELTMNTRDLRAHLASHNVRVSRIIAR